MKEVYVVNTCDEWRSYSSFSLVGIFTSRWKLNPVLNRLIKEKKIEYEHDSKCKVSVKNLTDRELNDWLTYVHVELITLNEVQ
jgi:hypothetical protein